MPHYSILGRIRSFFDRRPKGKRSFKWDRWVAIVISVIALFGTLLNLYVGSFRKIDDLSVIVARVPEITIEDERSAEGILRQVASVTSEIDMVYVSRGNRPIAVIKASFLIIQDANPNAQRKIL